MTIGLYVVDFHRRVISVIQPLSSIIQTYIARLAPQDLSYTFSQILDRHTTLTDGVRCKVQPSV